MNGTVFTPILIGFAVTIILFFISLLIAKNGIKATHVTLMATVFVFIISLVIGSWEGIGIGIISFGMLIGAVVLYMYQFVVKQKV